MQDIKKIHSTSRSRSTYTNGDIASRAEQYEKRSYLLNSESGEAIEEDKSSEKSIKIDRLSGRDNFLRRKDDLYYQDPRTIYVKKKASKGTVAFVVFLIAVIIYVILATYVFNSVTISFTPKHKEISGLSNKTFIFSQIETPGSILYKIATTTLSDTKSLPMSLTKKVESKASGKITIYNNYDGNEQKLIKNTRFETTDGKIYRINESIVIPGKKGDIPGSLEVMVYADSYGANYNIDPTTFTIPGFKGSDRYTSFSAKNTEKFVGGASGDMAIVSDSDLAAAKDELALSLDKKIKEELSKNIEPGYFDITDNVQVTFEDNERELKSGVTSDYKVTATGYMMQVDKKSLAKNIIAMDKDYHGEDVRIDDISKLNFAIKDGVYLNKDTQIEILVEGDTNVIWDINKEELSKKLLGKSVDNFITILRGEDSIDKATPEFSSIWLSTFPDKLSSIKYIEQMSSN